MTRKQPAARSTISASEFKATCLELMDELARTGGDIVVTKRGRPVVRVSAVGDQVASPLGFVAGTIVRHGDIVSADADAWGESSTDPLRPGR